jgi:hypothetical protein
LGYTIGYCITQWTESPSKVIASRRIGSKTALFGEIAKYIEGVQKNISLNNSGERGLKKEKLANIVAG